MIPIWKTEEKDKKSKKWAKMAQKRLKIVQFMNFPEGTGIKTH